MNINLTENEIKLLKTCLNYDDRETQLNDNFTNCTIEDAMKVLNWNVFQIGGLLSSLITKRLMYVENSSDRKQDDIYITEEGVNAIFDIIESGAI